MFGCQRGAAAAIVQILHKPKEGQFIEEDLRDLYQEVLPAVLQSTAYKFTEGFLEQEKRVTVRCEIIRSRSFEVVSPVFEETVWQSSYLQNASQLSVEKADELLALVILLRESKDHAPHRCQQLDGTHLVHVLLIKKKHEKSD